MNAGEKQLKTKETIPNDKYMLIGKKCKWNMSQVNITCLKTLKVDIINSSRFHLLTGSKMERGKKKVACITVWYLEECYDQPKGIVWAFWMISPLNSF